MDKGPNGGLEEYAQTLDLTPEEVVTFLEDAFAEDAGDEPPATRG